MLVLTRLQDEILKIGDDIEVIVTEVRGDKVRLGVTAPESVPVHRKEVYDTVCKEKGTRNLGCSMRTVDDIVALLNEMLEIDRAAVSNIMNTRYHCNGDMADHLTVQAQECIDGVGLEVGPLGILNGLFGIKDDGGGYIGMECDDFGKVLRFFKR